MSQWRDEINQALEAFITVTELAGDPVKTTEMAVDFLAAPHKPPSSLPAGYMAVYAFWWDGVWLKVGKVGPNSAARYISQHYNAGSAQSTLAGSLTHDPRIKTVAGFDPQEPGRWIKASTCRVNILIPAHRHKELLSLLEAFLHVRLRPRYEG